MIRALFMVAVSFILELLPPRNRRSDEAPRCITYILSGRVPVPCPDLMRWGQWMATQNRIVAHTEVGAQVVSTLFTGHDMNIFGGPPLLFETAILDDTGMVSQSRTSSWIEAKAAHAQVVADVERWATKTFSPYSGDHT